MNKTDNGVGLFSSTMVLKMRKKAKPAKPHCRKPPRHRTTAVSETALCRSVVILYRT